MKNPFISLTENGREYLTSNCSLNKVKIAKLPISEIEDEIQGKSVSEIFGAKIIIEDIKKNASELNIDISKYKEMDLPKVLGERLVSQNEKALEMSEKYGNRLGLILLILKTGLEENRIVREDWTDEHWRYWSEVKNIILAGGLASGNLGEKFIDTALELFIKAGIKPYNIIKNHDSSRLGAKGCLTQIEDKDNVHVLFDFGQTKIKRVIAVKEQNNERLIELDSCKSINMVWRNLPKKEKEQQAKELHNYLVDIICNTYLEASKYGKVGWKIVISIASYVIDGKINDERGGYAKLSTLGENYAAILAAELENRLKTNILIQLVHDGTAVALYYRNYENSACITLGTAIGVGFPEIKLN